MESSRMNTIMGMAMATAYTSGIWKNEEDFEDAEEWRMYERTVKEMIAMKESGKQVVWMPE